MTYYARGGKEISSSFRFDGELCTFFGSFIRQKHGTENIQAIEDSSLWYITYEQYRDFTQCFQEFNSVCRILLEECQQRHEERLAAMWMQPARDRYDWIMKENPDLLQRIAGKHLCSYLGITHPMLSMIRNYK